MGTAGKSGDFAVPCDPGIAADGGAGAIADAMMAMTSPGRGHAPSGSMPKRLPKIVAGQARIVSLQAADIPEQAAHFVQPIRRAVLRDDAQGPVPSETWNSPFVLLRHGADKEDRPQMIEARIGEDRGDVRGASEAGWASADDRPPQRGQHSVESQRPPKVAGENASLRALSGERSRCPCIRC